MFGKMWSDLIKMIFKPFLNDLNSFIKIIQR